MQSETIEDVPQKTDTTDEEGDWLESRRWRPSSPSMAKN